MYSSFSEKHNCYFVNNSFGYAISGVLSEELKQKKLSMVKKNEKTEVEIDKIYQQLSDMMIFSSHYFEETAFYKNHMDIYRDFFDRIKEEKEYVYWSENKHKTKDEESYNKYRSYMKKLEKEAEKECYNGTKHLLSGAKIEETEEFYESDYLLEGKPVLYHKVMRNLTVIENGKKVVLPLITKRLITVVENDLFVHVEPALFGNNEDLEYPITKERLEENKKLAKKNENEKPKKIKAINWVEGYYKTIEDAIKLGVMSKKE